MPCKAIQQSDEMACARCGLRWDVNDPDPPLCREKETAPEEKTVRRARDKKNRFSPKLRR